MAIIYLKVLFRHSRGPLNLVSTIKEILGKNNSGFGPECREYGRRDPSCLPRGTLYSQKFALTSPTSGDRSVGIVRSLTQDTEFSFLYSGIRMEILKKGTKHDIPAKIRNTNISYISRQLLVCLVARIGIDAGNNVLR
jgi:hypothetical protein